MKKMVAFVVAILPWWAVARAQAEVIDFEGISYISAGELGESLVVGDYRFTLSAIPNIGFLSITAQSDAVEPGTTKLFVANHAEMTMSRVDGAAFHLYGFDIGGTFTNIPQRWADEVRVSGSAGEFIAAIPDTEPIYLTHPVNHSNVTSVLFQPIAKPGAGISDYEFTLDNIHVSLVPKPAGSVLMLVGLMSLIALRRRDTGGTGEFT